MWHSQIGWRSSLASLSFRFFFLFSVFVFSFSSLGGQTATPRHLDETARSLPVASGEEGKRRTLYRWLPSNKENGDISLYQWLFRRRAIAGETSRSAVKLRYAAVSLDIFDSPQLMSSPAQVERSVAYNEHRPRTPPPDLPSMLLDGRIVYIGMPLVPAVTELVVAELMYLQWLDPKEPIYIYINSTGTTRDDGETVGMESEGFAIYDSLMQLKNEVHTVCVGAAIGHACLLLSAGTKGKRFMMPHSKAMIQQPRVPSSGLMPASDVLIRAKEVITNRDILVGLLSKHTGNSVETVANVMRRPYYMDAPKAKEFGVIDKILWRGQEKIIADVVPSDEFDKNAGIRSAERV